MSSSNCHYLSIELFSEKFRIISDFEKVIEFFEILYPVSKRINSINGNFHDFKIEVDSKNEHSYTIIYDDNSIKIDSEKYLITNVYLNFMKFFPTKVKNFFLFHGAAFFHNNKGSIIVGPPGYGKSTLSLALKFEGLNLLSDELGAICYKDNKLYPYNKLTTLRQDSLRFFPTLSSFQAEFILMDDTKKYLVRNENKVMDDKKGFDLHNVFILSNPNQEKHKSNVSHLILEKFDENVLQKLENIDDFKLIKIDKRKKYPVIYFDSKAIFETKNNIQLLCKKNGIQILSMESARFSKPDFKREPQLIEIQKTTGISELCEYMKGGLNSGIAKYTFKENVFEIFVHLMKTFNNTKFFYLYPGELKQTTKLMLEMLS